MTEIKERIRFLEKQYNFYYTNLRSVSSRLLDRALVLDNEPWDDEDDFSEYWTNEYLQRMYNILCAYFETLELNTYLKAFKDKFDPILSDEVETIKIASVTLKNGETDDDLKLLIDWKKFLAPFDFSWEKTEKEIIKLINFLKCTNQILKETNTSVFQEEDINKVIRKTANWYFSGVITYSQGYFVHDFTSYKPDVIIKEFNAAIEYKLIRKNEEIGTKLDELIIDALRYSGNSENRTCFAVFCLSTLVTITEKQIIEAWGNTKFPQNWHLVIIADVVVNQKTKNLQ